MKGRIEVASEVGKGTSFGIFLPATNEKARITKQPEAFLSPVRGGSETILLVEDEATVLAMGRVILQECGYRVLDAYSGVEALEVFERNAGDIDLLLTDIVVPQGLSGVELAQKLVLEKPSLKIMLYQRV